MMTTQFSQSALFYSSAAARAMRRVAGGLLTLALVAMATPRAVGQALPEKLDALFTNRRVFAAQTQLSLHVVAFPSGETLYGNNERLALIPASNQKLPITAAALELLPKNLTTEIFLTGRVVGDTLHGDIVVRGGGDPTLDGKGNGGNVMELLGEWARFFRAHGLRRITGDVIVDDRIFDRQFVHPDWPANQLHLSFRAPVAGLSINGNCLDVYVTPAPAAGGTPSATYWPPTPHFDIVNQARTIASGSPKLGLYRNPNSDRIRLDGTLGAGTYGPVHLQLPVQDPPRFAAGVFYEALRREGLRVDGEFRMARPDERLTPADGAPRLRHETPLTEAVRRANVYSDNMHAESLLKLLGAQNGQSGSFEGGAAAVERFMRQLAPGDEVRVADGSGLSRNNRLSARSLTALLDRMARSERAACFIGTLPAFGEEGTVRSRLEGSPAQGSVSGKTGYILGVSTLSGVVVARSGQVYFYSFLTNGIQGTIRPVRNVYDEACELIYLEG